MIKDATSGTVELLRATEAGKSYFAILHVDDGNYKAFNSKLDKAVVDESGKEITYHFTVAGTVSNAPSQSSPVTTVTPTVTIGGRE